MPPRARSPAVCVALLIGQLAMLGGSLWHELPHGPALAAAHTALLLAQLAVWAAVLLSRLRGQPARDPCRQLLRTALLCRGVRTLGTLLIASSGVLPRGAWARPLRHGTGVLVHDLLQPLGERLPLRLQLLLSLLDLWLLWVAQHLTRGRPLTLLEAPLLLFRNRVALTLALQLCVTAALEALSLQGFEASRRGDGGIGDGESPGAEILARVAGTSGAEAGSPLHVAEAEESADDKADGQQ